MLSRQRGIGRRTDAYVSGAEKSPETDPQRYGHFNFQVLAFKKYIS